MSKKSKPTGPHGRRQFDEDFKREAVQMLFDGHTAASIVERLGLSSTNLLYRWKREQLAHSGPVASSLDARVKELEAELRRVERERDILRKHWLFSAAAIEGGRGRRRSDRGRENGYCRPGVRLPGHSTIHFL